MSGLVGTAMGGLGSMHWLVVGYRECLGGLLYSSSIQHKGWALRIEEFRVIRVHDRSKGGCVFGIFGAGMGFRENGKGMVGWKYVNYCLKLTTDF